MSDPHEAAVTAMAAAAAPGRVARTSTLAYVAPLVVTLVWAIFVLASGELGRVSAQWASAVTMTVGSFLAGASPAGGGAVAFPVFTKILGVSPSVARTFSLCIQAVGMSMAALAILLTGRTIEVRALAISIGAGVAGFLAGLLALSDLDALFLASTLPPSYVKVTFTALLAGMAMAMFASLRASEYGVGRVAVWTPRMAVGLAAAAFLGGVLASLTGTGVNVLVFLFAVVVIGLHPRVGVPTSVIAMAVVSLVGLGVLGVIDGELAVSTNGAGEVVGVGGRAVGPLPASEYDLLGFWLAAVPVVVWGAPLGAWVVHRVREEWLVAAIALFATVEVISTVILLDDLRDDPRLIAYGVVALAVALGGVRWLAAHREIVCGLPVRTPRSGG